MHQYYSLRPINRTNRRRRAVVVPVVVFGFAAIFIHGIQASVNIVVHDLDDQLRWDTVEWKETKTLEAFELLFSI